MDETTCMTYLNRRYHMRKRSSRPTTVAITKRNCNKINVWGAIGWNGAIKFKVFVHFIILNYINIISRLFNKIYSFLQII